MCVVDPINEKLGAETYKSGNVPRLDSVSLGLELLGVGRNWYLIAGVTALHKF